MWQVEIFAEKSNWPPDVVLLWRMWLRNLFLIWFLCEKICFNFELWCALLLWCYNYVSNIPYSLSFFSFLQITLSHYPRPSLSLSLSLFLSLSLYVCVFTPFNIGFTLFLFLSWSHILSLLSSSNITESKPNPRNFSHDFFSPKNEW